MAVQYIVFWIIFSLSDAAITSTPLSTSECNGRSVNLEWVYDPTNFFVAEWNINGTLMLQYAPSKSPALVYSSGYENKLNHTSDGGIIVYNLTPSDSGNYSCITTYLSGDSFETEMVLTVHDMISVNLTCSYNQSAETIDCPVIPSSITSLKVNGIVRSTSAFPIKGTNSLRYTVCMDGDAANCRDDAIQQCISFDGRSATTTPTTPTTTTTTAPSSRPKKCFVLPKWKSCTITYIAFGCSLVSLIVICCIICYAIWKRKQKDVHEKKAESFSPDTKKIAKNPTEQETIAKTQNHVDRSLNNEKYKANWTELEDKEFDQL